MEIDNGTYILSKIVSIEIGAKVAEFVGNGDALHPKPLLIGALFAVASDIVLGITGRAIRRGLGVSPNINDRHYDIGS